VWFLCCAGRVRPERVEPIPAEVLAICQSNFLRRKIRVPASPFSSIPASACSIAKSRASTHLAPATRRIQSGSSTAFHWVAVDCVRPVPDPAPSMSQLRQCVGGSNQAAKIKRNKRFPNIRTNAHGAHRSVETPLAARCWTSHVGRVANTTPPVEIRPPVAARRFLTSRHPRHPGEGTHAGGPTC